jgi:soluble lytic murein transglycosylase-like protein
VLASTATAQQASVSAEAQVDPRQTTRAAMEASVAKQRESVRRQMEAAALRPEQSRTQPDARSDWYTTPWIGPVGSIAPISGIPLVPAETPAAPHPVPPKTAAGLVCDPISSVSLSPLIQDAADREGLSPDLLRAVIRKESAGYPCAVSSKGAMGLMQLMPGTAANFGVADPMNPEDNVGAGARFLGQLLERYAGNLSLALAAYNAGPGKVDAYGGVPPYPETKNYVRDILNSLGGVVSRTGLH